MSKSVYIQRAAIEQGNALQGTMYRVLALYRAYHGNYPVQHCTTVHQLAQAQAVCASLAQMLAKTPAKKVAKKAYRILSAA